MPTVNTLKIQAKNLRAALQASCDRCSREGYSLSAIDRLLAPRDYHDQDITAPMHFATASNPEDSQRNSRYSAR